MHSRVWAGEARSGEGTLASPPFLFGCHDSVSSAFRWGGNACVPAVPMLPMATPPVGASVVRSGWVGLHGRPWGGVGTLTIHRQAQFSRRLTTYHHKSPPDSLLVILSASEGSRSLPKHTSQPSTPTPYLSS